MSPSLQSKEARRERLHTSLFERLLQSGSEYRSSETSFSGHSIDSDMHLQLSIRRCWTRSTECDLRSRRSRTTRFTKEPSGTLPLSRSVRRRSSPSSCCRSFRRLWDHHRRFPPRDRRSSWTVRIRRAARQSKGSRSPSLSSPTRHPNPLIASHC